MTGRQIDFPFYGDLSSGFFREPSPILGHLRAFPRVQSGGRGPRGVWGRPPFGPGRKGGSWGLGKDVIFTHTLFTPPIHTPYSHPLAATSRGWVATTKGVRRPKGVAGGVGRA